MLPLIFIQTGCDSDSNPEADVNLFADEVLAKITERDMRRCACCGGYFIEIGNETYRFLSMPATSSFAFLDDELPMDVIVRWSTDPNQCLGDEIILESIRPVE